MDDGIGRIVPPKRDQEWWTRNGGQRLVGPWGLLRDGRYGLGLYHDLGFSTETVVIGSWLSLPWGVSVRPRVLSSISALYPTDTRGILLLLGCGQVAPMSGETVPGKN